MWTVFTVGGTRPGSARLPGLRGLMTCVGLAMFSWPTSETLARAEEGGSATVEEVTAKVEEAARFLHDKGQAGFSDFGGSARWVWKDSYVFVFSCLEDRMLAHPLRPDLVGRSILQMEDEKGNLLFRKLCEAGQTESGGWVEYWWPKPGEAKASRKITYTRPAEVSFRADVRVGAGIYDAERSVAKLNQGLEADPGARKDAP
ncbi:MAG: cache domain-containing protein [Myxococcota bacterium]